MGSNKTSYYFTRKEEKMCNRRGYELYEKGGTTKERLLAFLEKNVFGKYKNHLIIMDNAGSHHNDLIKEAIIKSGNQILYSVPYTPKSNSIEQYFNQLKYYLKKYRNVNDFQQLKQNVQSSIHKIKPLNYANYFKDAYDRKRTWNIHENHLPVNVKLKNIKIKLYMLQ